MVALFPTDRRFWIDFGVAPRRLKMTRASAQGAFSITGIPAGQYIIAAYPDALANSWNGIDEMFQILSTMGRTIDVKDGEMTSVTLPMLPGVELTYVSAPIIINGADSPTARDKARIIPVRIPGNDAGKT